jgi:hypothetical protein
MKTSYTPAQVQIRDEFAKQMCEACQPNQHKSVHFSIRLQFSNGLSIQEFLDFMEVEFQKFLAVDPAAREMFEDAGK